MRVERACEILENGTIVKIREKAFPSKWTPIGAGFPYFNEHGYIVERVEPGEYLVKMYSGPVLLLPRSTFSPRQHGPRGLRKRATTQPLNIGVEVKIRAKETRERKNLPIESPDRSGHVGSVVAIKEKMNVIQFADGSELLFQREALLPNPKKQLYCRYCSVLLTDENSYNVQNHSGMKYLCKTCSNIRTSVFQIRRLPNERQEEKLNHHKLMVQRYELCMSGLTETEIMREITNNPAVDK